MDCCALPLWESHQERRFWTLAKLNSFHHQENTLNCDWYLFIVSIYTLFKGTRKDNSFKLFKELRVRELNFWTEVFKTYIQADFFFFLDSVTLEVSVKHCNYWQQWGFSDPTFPRLTECPYWSSQVDNCQILLFLRHCGCNWKVPRFNLNHLYPWESLSRLMKSQNGVVLREILILSPRVQ